MLRADLEDASIAYVDDAGLFADFHSLRHSFVSMLAAGNVHPKLAQRLARHSDINLTMSRYSHTLLADEATAMGALPQVPSIFPGNAGDSQTLRATGTDNATPPAGNVLPSCLPDQTAKPCIPVHHDAPPEGSEPTPATETKEPRTSGKPGESAVVVPLSVAERVGFEPTVPLRTLRFSRPVANPRN